MAIKLTEQQLRWIEHIRASERMGGTMKAYADAQGLDVQEFYHWKSFLRQKGLLDVSVEAAPRFERLRVESEPAPVDDCRVVLPNGVVLEMATPTTGQAWRELLQAAWSLS